MSAKTSPLIINEEYICSGIENTPYKCQLSATGGKLPYTWTFSELPNGLIAHSKSGKITGMPLIESESTITVTVEDINGKTNTKKYLLCISSMQVIIDVISPSNNSVWHNGEIYDIIWIPHVTDNGTLDIDLVSRDKLHSLATNVPINSRKYSYKFDINVDPGNDNVIRVTTNYGDVYESAPFIVIQPHLSSSILYKFISFFRRVISVLR
jgi:hypothetical protein